MIVRLGLPLMTAAIALVSAGAMAQQTQPSTDARVAKKSLDPNQVVCEKQEVVGSRLATRRVCMTRSQWADARSQDRLEIEKVQMKRGGKQDNQ